MSKVCPQCDSSFIPARKDQKYCCQSCRQQDYIKRKYGFTDKNIEQPINNVAKDVALDLPESGKANNPSIPNSDQNTETATDQLMTLLGQVLGSMASGASLGSLLPAFQNKNSMALPSKVETSKSVNDGLTDKNILDSFQSKSTEKSFATAINNRQLNNPQENSFDVQKMLSDQLIDSYEFDIFQAHRYPNWSELHWNTVHLVNKKFTVILTYLMQYCDYRSITIKKLNQIIHQLDEFRNGIYNVLLPSNYPFKNFFRFLQDKLIQLVNQRDETMNKIVFKLSSDLANQLVFIKMQIGDPIQTSPD